MAYLDYSRIDAAIAAINDVVREALENLSVAQDRVKELEKQLDASERRNRTMAAELIEEHAKVMALEAQPGAMLQ